MRKDPCGQMVGTVWLVIVVLGTMVQGFSCFLTVFFIYINDVFLTTAFQVSSGYFSTMPY